MSKPKPPRTIPLSEPLIAGNEWAYVKECLDTGWVSYLGAYVTRFEEAVADYLGVPYAVAVTSGTAALHLSLLAEGVGPGDEVIVPTLTFIAPVNAVRYCGAHPVFMDCDPATLCMDMEKVADFVTRGCEKGRDGYIYNRLTKRRVRAIVPVHVFGHPADMDPLLAIEEEEDCRLAVIEDATESLGSLYKGRKVGCLGSAGCLSFNGNKIITTGGGGMVVTHHQDLAEWVRHLSTQAKKDPVEYDHDHVGYNYRLPNVLAAIGVAQLEKLPGYIAVKQRNKALYRDLLRHVEGVSLIDDAEWAESNCWFYTLVVGERHKAPLMEYLGGRGIQVRPLWKPIHSLDIYRDEQAYGIEHAPRAYARCLNLPCSVGLKEKDLVYTADAIKAYFGGV